MPWVASRPLILFTCCTRSAISRWRSRCVRLASSRSTEDTCTMWQAARSPRHHAIRARSSIAASSRSVLARPCPAVDLEAAGVHYPAGDPLGRKAALEPEPVVTGLVAEDNLHRAAARLLFARLQPTQQPKQAGDVAALQAMGRGFAAR